MNNKSVKKLRQFYKRDLRVGEQKMFDFFFSKKPWYIPKKVWAYWITK